MARAFSALRPRCRGRDYARGVRREETDAAVHASRCSESVTPRRAAVALVCLLEFEGDADNAPPEAEAPQRQIDRARIILLKRPEIPEVAANSDAVAEE